MGFGGEHKIQPLLPPFHSFGEIIENKPENNITETVLKV